VTRKKGYAVKLWIKKAGAKAANLVALPGSVSCAALLCQTAEQENRLESTKFEKRNQISFCRKYQSASFMWRFVLFLKPNRQ